MIDGERLGVAFGLTLGLHHCLGPTGCAAPGGAAGDTGFGGLAEDVEIVLALVGRRPIRLAALLGFKDEAAALVAVDPAEAGGTVAIVLKDAALEDVVVRGIVSLRAARRIDTEQPGQTVDEGLGVCEFAAAGAAPFSYKAFNFIGFEHLP